MKTLLFSDTHLSSILDPDQFYYLEDIISRANRVIINGDFWDRWFVTFDQFINSQWRLLFPLLKEKKAVYLFGNHDQKEWTDSRVSEFSVRQGKQTILYAGSKRLLVTHGDAMTPSLELFIPWHSARNLNARVGQRVESAGVRHLGPSFQQLGSFMNKTMKTFAQEHMDQDEILICGHSHLPEHSLDEQFVNSGLNRHGLGQHVWIEDDDIELVMEQWGPEPASVAEWGTTWPSPGKIFQQSSAAQAMRTFFDFKPNNGHNSLAQRLCQAATGDPKEHDV